MPPANEAVPLAENNPVSMETELHGILNIAALSLSFLSGQYVRGIWDHHRGGALCVH